VKVAKPILGHWQVAIKALRIGNRTVGSCEDGSCRGIVDTGTSHLGIPGPFVQEVADLLSVPVDGGLEDCREAEGLKVELELDGGIKLELSPRNYMRRLPLKDGVNVGSTNGVSLLPETPEASFSPDESESKSLPSEGEPRTCKPRPSLCSRLRGCRRMRPSYFSCR